MLPLHPAIFHFSLLILHFPSFTLRSATATMGHVAPVLTPMINIRAAEFTLPALAGSRLAKLWMVRLPGSPGDAVDMLMLRFEGSNHLHRIVLDALGEVHWVELTREELLSSIDEDCTKTELPLESPLSSPLVSAGASIRHCRTCIQSALILVFESGARITLAYPAEDMAATRPGLEIVLPIGSRMRDRNASAGSIHQPDHPASPPAWQLP